MKWLSFFYFEILVGHINILSFLYFSIFLLCFIKLILPIILNNANDTYEKEIQLEKHQQEAIKQLQREYLNNQEIYKNYKLSIEKLEQSFPKAQQTATLRYKTLCHQYDSEVQRQATFIKQEYEISLLYEYFNENREDIKCILCKDHNFMQKWQDHNMKEEPKTLNNTANMINSMETSGNAASRTINFTELLDKIDSQW
jgi:hypothetical protein